MLYILSFLLYVMQGNVIGERGRVCLGCFVVREEGVFGRIHMQDRSSHSPYLVLRLDLLLVISDESLLVQYSRNAEIRNQIGI
ncbi:hypothetical protein C8Q69DRAFT_68230 [Paecilomyces variotii]|uniref:Secreted protein n=1 Tax=Byssochlamys spectabilis TaxID=264951 RepID=A0A443HNH4_BYSSP|nr:hypothetical protein C8Q69DRAFT_68230 [Paecilomyces variotii]RWQ93376.1 hypothetical protein C8Q69DRAFT_68230 [Paecilomyces variotii]